MDQHCDRNHRRRSYVLRFFCHRRRWYVQRWNHEQQRLQLRQAKRRRIFVIILLHQICRYSDWFQQYFPLVANIPFFLNAFPHQKPKYYFEIWNLHTSALEFLLNRLLYRHGKCVMKVIIFFGENIVIPCQSKRHSHLKIYEKSIGLSATFSRR